MEDLPATEPPSMPTVAAAPPLAYATGHGAGFWRQAVMWMGAGCLVLLALDVAMGGWVLWQQWAEEGQYGYLKLLLLKVAGPAGVTLYTAFSAGWALAGAAGVIGATRALVGRGGQALLLAGLLGTAACHGTVVAFQSWAVWGTGSLGTEWGYLLMWVGAELRGDLPKLLLAALILSQWRNPSVVQAVSRGRGERAPAWW